MILAMTALHSHLKPAVILEQIYEFLNLHVESLHVMPICRITPKVTGGLDAAKRRQDRPVENLVGRHSCFSCQYPRPMRAYLWLCHLR